MVRVYQITVELQRTRWLFILRVALTSMIQMITSCQCPALAILPDCQQHSLAHMSEPTYDVTVVERKGSTLVHQEIPSRITAEVESHVPVRGSDFNRLIVCAGKRIIRVILRRFSLLS